MTFESVDWLQPSIKPKIALGGQLSASQFPFSRDHASPIPLLFLSDLDERGMKIALRAETGWLVRDGEIPLRSVFKKYPVPPKTHSAILYIDESLRKLVPNAWRETVCYFRLKTRIWTGQSQALENASRPNLLFTDLVNQNSLRSKIGQLENFEKALLFIRRFPKSKIYALSFFDGFAGRAEPLTYANDFFSKHKIQVTWVSAGVFTFRLDMRSFEIARVEGNTWIADDFLTNAALASGARFVQETPRGVGKGASFVRLSPYHGYELR